ncbi:MAG TPA: GNAT family N-acetyltransferase [Alphaproteobacteria bacterium]|jgi:GNAT superfamily N-acetyltransferase
MTHPQRIAAEAMSFRAAVVADIPALQRLYGELIPDEEPTGDDMQATLARILADPDDGEIVVCELDGEVVATCQLIVYDNLVRTPYKKAMIDSVVVEERCRHRGIGSAMMAWSLEELRRRGCSKIIVATGFTRRDAHEMYSKLGFEHFGHSFIMTCKGEDVPVTLPGRRPARVS